MDDIRIYKALVRASYSGQSGIGDIRDDVWKGIDSTGLACADKEGEEYRYINVLSMRIASIAAVAMVSCLVAGYITVDNYLKGEAMLSPYYDVLDRMSSVVWGFSDGVQAYPQ